MQEIHISMEEVKNYYAGRHLISMEERILPRQFEFRWEVANMEAYCGQNIECANIHVMLHT